MGMDFTSPSSRIRVTLRLQPSSAGWLSTLWCSSFQPASEME